MLNYSNLRVSVCVTFTITALVFFWNTLFHFKNAHHFGIGTDRLVTGNHNRVGIGWEWDQVWVFTKKDSRKWIFNATHDKVEKKIENIEQKSKNHISLGSM